MLREEEAAAVAELVRRGGRWRDPRGHLDYLVRDGRIALALPL